MFPGATGEEDSRFTDEEEQEPQPSEEEPRDTARSWSPESRVTEEVEASGRIGTRKAPGPDGVPTRLWKYVAGVLAPTLMRLFDRCLPRGEFPVLWKETRMVLLPKPGRSPASPSVYRQVCLLHGAGKLLLIQIKNRLETYETELRAIQNEIITIDEEETARGFEIADEYEKIELRVTNQLNNIRRTTPSQSTNGESAAGRESASLKLPEIRIPTFDGILEDWQSFSDSFSSTIDQNEQLTPVQKFYHLRSALTGWAARSIQSLAITESNYAIAINVLKEKFDCHRPICMRHWDLIFDYPKITKETPEAIDDFLETVKVNLQALEKLGEPVTSNIVLI